MNAECGMRNAECGLDAACAAAAPIPNSEIRNPQFRRGITLVELLITMAIMAIISAAILGTASAAMDSARRSRTQSLVTKIQGLLSDKLAAYETRRVTVDDSVMNPLHLAFPNVDAVRGMAEKDVELLARRELVKFEMPDRWIDVTEAPQFLHGLPSTTINMRRQYMQMRLKASVEDIVRHQGAECLYMTVMLGTADGEARTVFSDQDMADVDGDGAREFVDGWGNPISWIRWPAGFFPHSAIMARDPLLLPPAQVAAAAKADHDPLDVFRRDQPDTMPLPAPFPPNLRPYIARLRDNTPAFRLPPLVYSLGKDAASDINTSHEKLSVLDPKIVLDPYSLQDPTEDYEPGVNNFMYGAAYDVNEDGSDNFKDNIHSHWNEY